MLLKLQCISFTTFKWSFYIYLVLLILRVTRPQTHIPLRAILGVLHEFYFYFANRLAPPDWSRPETIEEFPHHLSPKQSEGLEIPITFDEVKKAVWDYGPDKASGPDEFTFEFFKNLMGVSVSYDHVKSMASMIGCKPATLPMSYLGIKVGDNMTRINAWKEVLSKVSNKLSRLSCLNGFGDSDVRLMLYGSKLLNPFMVNKIRDGRNTQFWNDAWIGDQPLKSKFLRLYALEMEKDVSVANKIKQGMDSSSFRCHPRGGPKSEQWEVMQNIIMSTCLSPMEDR
nr:hypothetical protein [Tanacetum cinerariifolium]